MARNRKQRAREEAPIFLSRKQVAEMIGLSLPSLWRLQRADPSFPPAISLTGRRRVFERAAVEAWAREVVYRGGTVLAEAAGGAGGS